MPGSSNRPRVIVLANKDRPAVAEALATLRPWLDERARVVAEPDGARFDHAAAGKLPAADLLLVLGGDGTILGQARNTVDLGLPMIGVNVGKLGFLTEFTFEDLQTHWDKIAAGQCGEGQRTMIEVMVLPPDADYRPARLDPAACSFRSLGLNDAVITAGEPFRMIELGLSIDPPPDRLRPTVFSGDGVIVSTPSGSTAYNLSSNGPIVNPDLDALCITPICPHSLAFRPIVACASCNVHVRVQRPNPGTALVIDGQVSVGLKTDEQVLVRRYGKTLRLLVNPGVSYWQMLARKMHWAVRPSRE